jgi:hypothetical protein
VHADGSMATALEITIQWIRQWLATGRCFRLVR